MVAARQFETGQPAAVGRMAEKIHRVHWPSGGIVYTSGRGGVGRNEITPFHCPCHLLGANKGLHELAQQIKIFQQQKLSLQTSFHRLRSN
jgi:hypothetical protein